MVETLKYSLTMSGTNTFTEFEKSLEQEIGQKRRGKRGNSTKVMMIRAITIQWSSAAALAAADIQRLQITTNSESDMVDISDKDCYFRAEIYTNGAAVEPRDIVRRYVVNLPYIKKEMFIGVDSESLAAAATYHIQIEFDYKYINDWKLARIISRKA